MTSLEYQYPTFEQLFVKINVPVMVHVIQKVGLACVTHSGCPICTISGESVKPIAVSSKHCSVTLILMNNYFWISSDWSILYVVIGIFIIFIMISGICCALTCYCCKAKPRCRSKTQKYALLESQDNDVANCMLINPKYLFPLF